MYADNPEYEILKTIDIYNIYVPIQDTKFDKSREVEATIQNIYSNSGATAETIASLCNAGLEMINKDKNNETLRTNMTAILQNLLYRTQHPVDGLCGVRMGCILSLLEYESNGTVISEPVEYSYAWLDRKMRLVNDHPELYSFFLTWGIRNTAAYFNKLDILTDTDYFHRRSEMIASFNPSAVE